ncbi:hypothetical protein [Parasediminibacterium sp. JCM 36343]|uniref:hypothetical protein n=1 Tax=Parasediminibacterium sp. JCM 36343 TaxID=3374279 RepID=UPI00397C00BB
MKQILFLVSLISFLVLLNMLPSCKSKKNNAAVIAKPTVIDTSTFYDIKSFFLSEIKEVSSTPYYMYSIIKRDDKRTDSFAVTKAKFAQLANEFVEKDITTKELKPYYKQNIFRDLSTNSITFNYTTPNKQLEVQNIDILIDEETSKVKYIFIRTSKGNDDSTIISQFNWKPGKSFSINKSIVKSNGIQYGIQQIVNWNDNLQEQE